MSLEGFSAAEFEIGGERWLVLRKGNFSHQFPVSRIAMISMDRQDGLCSVHVEWAPAALVVRPETLPGDLQPRWLGDF